MIEVFWVEGSSPQKKGCRLRCIGAFSQCTLSAFTDALGMTQQFSCFANFENKMSVCLLSFSSNVLLGVDSWRVCPRLIWCKWIYLDRDSSIFVRGGFFGRVWKRWLFYFYDQDYVSCHLCVDEFSLQFTIVQRENPDLLFLALDLAGYRIEKFWLINL